MKPQAIMAIAILFSTPALAGSEHLARSLGVEPGLYTLQQLVQLKGREGASPGNAHVYFGEGAGQPGVVNATAEAKFNELAAEQFNGSAAMPNLANTSRRAINPVAQAKFKALSEEN